MRALIVVTTCYITGRVVTDHVHTLESPGFLLGALEKMGPMRNQSLLCKFICGLVWLPHNDFLQLDSFLFTSSDGSPDTFQRLAESTLT